MRNVKSDRCFRSGERLKQGEDLAAAVNAAASAQSFEAE